MKSINTFKVNFKGGIVYPNELYNILVAAAKFGLKYVRFGLRQQLLFDVEIEDIDRMSTELEALGVSFEINNEAFPNVMSSYPAEETFIVNSWLNAGIYKQIFEAINYAPRFKINISDANQSFTPLFTGNINWVASPCELNFWHLFIRFPKTNIVYEWKDLVDTKDLAVMSLAIEETILKNTREFYDNNEANGDDLYKKIKKDTFTCKASTSPLELPAFNLPYYEGMNRYNDKYWLGIYRRDELFRIKFLKEVCLLCVANGIGQLCTTPWKSIIVKGIERKNKNDWYHLLDKYQINVRHAVNELNFQVEDNSLTALRLKEHLVKYLNDDDTRTFGVCIGIKTRRKSEVFSSILVRRKPLFRIGKIGFFYTYDILCAKDYNPNERTDFIYSKDNPKFVLAEQLRRAILSFYQYHDKKNAMETGTVDQPNIEQEA